MGKIELRGDEWLLKVFVDNAEPNPMRRRKGFLTKLTKKGEVPKAFEMWPRRKSGNDVVTSEIHKEEFSVGWMILGYRRGASQDWAILRHPKGFTLEIYLLDFLDLLPNITIKDGYLIGNFMLVGNNLCGEY